MRSMWLVVVMFTTGALAGAPTKAPAKAPPAAPAAAPAPAPAAPAAAGDAGPAVKLDGAKLFMERTCFACHGKDAKTPLLPDYPRLAGQQAAYAEKQMKDIKNGVRTNGNTAAMKGIMPLVNDDEIHAIAEYISTLK